MFLARSNNPIKNENQIIVRSKQPIKTEKPFQSLVTFLTALAKKIFFRVFCCHLLQVIFSMPSKVILIVIEFMSLGINIFWAILRAHFNPRLPARAKDKIFVIGLKILGSFSRCCNTGK